MSLDLKYLKILSDESLKRLMEALNGRKTLRKLDKAETKVLSDLEKEKGYRDTIKRSFQTQIQKNKIRGVLPNSYHSVCVMCQAIFSTSEETQNYVCRDCLEDDKQ